jgi:hypothetical protein
MAKELTMKCFILFLLLSTSLLASDKEWRESNEGIHILESYEIDGRWVLEVYLVKPGKLQDKILSKSFPTRFDLKKFQEGHYRKLRKQDSSQLLFTNSENRNSKIWTPANSWNLSWEKVYSAWVKKEFNKDFFVKYNIKTDCADVAFSLRWIFARIHSLPAANTLAGSGVLFTHESMKNEWSKKPTATEWHKDQRFLAALNYLLQNSYTKTLYKDTYPIKIAIENFHEGTINLLGHHTQIISKLDFSGESAPIWLLQSTMPSMIRVLSEEVMMDPAPTDKALGGVVQMRWPVYQNGKWLLTPRNLMPAFSEEQYDPAFINDTKNFTLSIINRLQISFIPKNIVNKSLESIATSLQERVAIVKEGHDFCLINDCSDGTTNYENYSTPSRDKRLKEKFKAVDELASMLSQFDDSLPSYLKDLLSTTTITIEGSSKNLKTYKLLFDHSFPSYHPNDTVSERWALDKNASYSALYKKFKRLLATREKLLTEASSCVQNSQCLLGTKNWKQFNTYDFDSKFKKEVYYGFYFLGQYYSGTRTLSKSQEEEIKSIAAILSEPTESYSKRKGQHFLDVAHLGITKRLVELSENIFLIDDKIIDINTKEVKLEGFEKLIFLDDTNHLLYAVRNQILQVIDGENGQLEAEFENEFEVKGFWWLGGQNFVLSDCQNFDFYSVSDGEARCQVKILNYESGNFHILQNFNQKKESFQLSYNLEYDFVREKAHMTWLFDKSLQVLHYFDGSNVASISLNNLDKTFNQIYSDSVYLAYHTRNIKSGNLDLNLIDRNSGKDCTIQLIKGESLSSFSKGNIFILYNSIELRTSLVRLEENCSFKTITSYISKTIYNIENDSSKPLFYVFNSNSGANLNLLELFVFDQGNFKKVATKKDEFTLQVDDEHLYLYKTTPSTTMITKYNFASENSEQIESRYIPQNCKQDKAVFPCPISQNLYTEYSLFTENNVTITYREIFNEFNEVVLNSIQLPFWMESEVEQSLIYVKTRNAYSPAANSYIVW